MSQATRAALHRTIRRSCRNAEDALGNAQRKVNHAMRRQFLNPDLGLDDEERKLMQAHYETQAAAAFDTLHEWLAIGAVDVYRFRAQQAAEAQIDARLGKEKKHGNRTQRNG